MIKIKTKMILKIEKFKEFLISKENQHVRYVDSVYEVISVKKCFYSFLYKGKMTGTNINKRKSGIFFLVFFFLSSFTNLSNKLF